MLAVRIREYKSESWAGSKPVSAAVKAYRKTFSAGLLVWAVAEKQEKPHRRVNAAGMRR
jgi:hypothetical protein